MRSSGADKSMSEGSGRAVDQLIYPNEIVDAGTTVKVFFAP